MASEWTASVRSKENCNAVQRFALGRDKSGHKFRIIATLVSSFTAGVDFILAGPADRYTKSRQHCFNRLQRNRNIESKRAIFHIIQIVGETNL